MIITRYFRRVDATEFIQNFYRRYRRLFLWKYLVYTSLHLFRPKAILIQSKIRQFLCQRRFFMFQNNLLQEYEGFLSGRKTFNDSNEFENWHSFGMTPYFATAIDENMNDQQEKTEKQEKSEYFSVLEWEIPSQLMNKWKNTSSSQTAPSSSKQSQQQKQLPKQGKSTSDATSTDHSSHQSESVLYKYLKFMKESNEFLPVIEMLSLPEIPPNCLFPKDDKTILFGYNPRVELYEEELERKQSIFLREKEKRDIEGKQDLPQESSLINDTTSEEEEMNNKLIESQETKSIGLQPVPTSNDNGESNENVDLTQQKTINDTILKNIITKSRIAYFQQNKRNNGDSVTTTTGPPVSCHLSYGFLDLNEWNKDMKDGLNSFIDQFLLNQVRNQTKDIDEWLSEDGKNSNEESSFFQKVAMKFN
jgi:hypothetical protein